MRIHMLCVTRGGISSIQLVTLTGIIFLGSTLTLFLLVQINGKFTSDQSLIYNVSALYLTPLSSKENNL